MIRKFNYDYIFLQNANKETPTRQIVTQNIFNITIIEGNDFEIILFFLCL